MIMMMIVVALVSFCAADVAAMFVAAVSACIGTRVLLTVVLKGPSKVKVVQLPAMVAAILAVAAAAAAISSGRRPS